MLKKKRPWDQELSDPGYREKGWVQNWSLNVDSQACYSPILYPIELCCHLQILKKPHKHPSVCSTFVNHYSTAPQFQQWEMSMVPTTSEMGRNKTLVSAILGRETTAWVNKGLWTLGEMVTTGASMGSASRSHVKMSSLILRMCYTRESMAKGVSQHPFHPLLGQLGVDLKWIEIMSHKVWPSWGVAGSVSKLYPLRQ